MATMRRDYRETWETGGTIFDAIAAMRARIEALAPRKPNIVECSVNEFASRRDGVQDSWSVTIEYRADDET